MVLRSRTNLEAKADELSASLVVFAYDLRNIRLQSLYTSTFCLIINRNIYFVYFCSYYSRKVFRRVKRQGRETDHSPSSAEVENGRAIPPLPPLSS
jgi:hypothetical protein